MTMLTTTAINISAEGIKAMSCYSIVSLQTEVRATPEEIADAALSLGILVTSINECAVECDGAQFTRANSTSAWSVNAPVSFDLIRFRREVARAKVLAVAKRQGYRITQNQVQGDRIVIRMKAL